jgi:adenylylsulfate kinase
VAYEPAESPELIIDTARERIEDAGRRVAALSRAFPAARERAAEAAAGWAVWISGRPGSGKTTVTSGVCQKLAALGTAVTVLDAAEFADFIVPGGPFTAAQREIAMRAVVEAARRLHDLGAAVVIDGTTRMADGGRVAREVIDVFAQVELACPPDVCRTRERAVRWQLFACPGVARPMAAPELGLDYEPAAHPDLVLFTDVLAPRTAAEEVVRLVERLERSARGRRQSCA